MKKLGSLLLLLLPPINAGAADSVQPAFHPGELWLDNNGVAINAHAGGLSFHDKRWYWFGEHKIAGREGNHAMVGVHCYSSDDLYHWQDEKIALAVSDDPNSEIAKGCILERPKVLYNEKTQRFVMWFHLERKGKGYKDARSAVAIAEAPAGPYTFLYSLRPNANIWPEDTSDDLKKPLTAAELRSLERLEFAGGPVKEQIFPANLLFRRDFAGGQMARDMTLFVDDDRDQTAFHIYSSEENGTLQISQLTSDYTKPAGKFGRVLIGKFNEAPTMFKHHGKYFLITSGTTGWAPNPARLAVADNIFGPYSELGNPCRGSPDDVATTFHAQGTFVARLPGTPDAIIFLADRWAPANPIDGRYVWLPIQFVAQRVPYLEWRDT